MLPVLQITSQIADLIANFEQLKVCCMQLQLKLAVHSTARPRYPLFPSKFVCSAVTFRRKSQPKTTYTRGAWNLRIQSDVIPMPQSWAMTLFSIAGFSKKFEALYLCSCWDLRIVPCVIFVVFCFFHFAFFALTVLGQIWTGFAPFFAHILF